MTGTIAVETADRNDRRSATTSAPWRLGYRPGLDGYRAIGMVTMMGFHSEIALARGAFLSLSQFFTLSGFLVMSGLLTGIESGAGINVRNFLNRRVRRLWPGSLLGLAVIAVYGATVADASQSEVLPLQVLGAATHMANWFFIVEDTSYVNQFASPSPVQHYWSLSFEEQFYVLLPFGILLLRRFSTSIRALAGVLVAAVLAGVIWLPYAYGRWGVDRVYYGTDTRLAEILTGALLAVLLHRYRERLSPRLWRFFGWAGGLAYLIQCWMSTRLDVAEPLMWRGGIILFSVGSCLVITGILSDTGPLRLLSKGPLPALGRIAYSLYIFHLPIFLWLDAERTGLDQYPLFALRLAVTLPVALLSYRLVEQPIRDRRRLVSGGRRLWILPNAAALIVAATFLTAGQGSSDPWETLRGRDQAAPPVEPVDHTLDVLVISDPVGQPLVDRLLVDSDTDPDIAVTVAPTFECSKLSGASPDRVCSDWDQEWMRLVSDVDPDVVLLYVHDWSDDEIIALTGDPAAVPADAAEEVMANGIDILTGQGASVVWATGARSFTDQSEQSGFRLAMRTLIDARSDVQTTGYLKPVPADPDDEFLDEATDTILEALRTHRRAPSNGLPRVMVVGDSQAGAIGYGLERLAAATRETVVWDRSSPGCGIVVDGAARDMLTDAVVEANRTCVDSIGSWATAVEQFDPDIVLVLSSLRDLQDRQLVPGGEFATVGEADFDQFLLERYLEAVDLFSASGATVVWMKPPCVRYESPLGGGGEAPRVFDPERIEHLRDVIIPELKQQRPDQVELFDLGELLCPDGTYADDVAGLTDVRPDGVHPSAEAALWIAEQLDDEVIANHR